MGGRSSPFIFHNVSAAIEWVCINNYLIEVLMEPPDNEPTALVLLKQIFQYLGVPLAPDEVFGPSQVLEVLGIILDTPLMQARLSPEKIQKLQQTISSLQSHRKCTKRQLLSLIGSLSFMSRFIKLSCTVSGLQHFMYSKTDLFGKGHIVTLHVTNTLTCPVRVMKRYLETKTFNLTVIDKTSNHPKPSEPTRNHLKSPEPTQKSPESSPDIIYTDPKNGRSTQTGPITASFELRRFLV